MEREENIILAVRLMTQDLGELRMTRNRRHNRGIFCGSLNYAGRTGREGMNTTSELVVFIK